MKEMKDMKDMKDMKENDVISEQNPQGVAANSPTYLHTHIPLQLPYTFPNHPHRQGNLKQPTRN